MNTDKLIARVLEILKIPSPTYKERELSRYLRARYFAGAPLVSPSTYKKRQPIKAQKNRGKDRVAHKSANPKYEILSVGDSFIASERVTQANALKPHLALVGHLDVVPPHRLPQLIGSTARGKISGAGASDMKASLGVYLYLLKDTPAVLQESPYRVSFVFYAKEEQTPLEENGLYELIRAYPQWFRNVDLAVVGEPTDNTIQLGCVGSIHAHLYIKGKSSHSARPWQGINALYKSLPVLNKLARIKPTPHNIGGVVFYDVLEVTELMCEPGTTSLPGWVKANVNFRFAPRFNKSEAMNYFKQLLARTGLKPSEYRLGSFSPMGKVVPSDLYREVTHALQARGVKVEAKQAWTDVAQFGSLNIPAFNFGPGLTAQCHTKNEYASVALLRTYTQLLTEVITGKGGKNRTKK